MPEGAKCDCGCTEFTKEKDIMDVWFDSGSTWAAVCDQNPEHPELSYPADLYLEGGDQYRGWFQSSMLTSIAARGVAPYRHIITHGWTVDGKGKAMHKSLGNTVAPQDIIKDYGADILRLWVSSADYTQDMRISKPILKQLSDAYLKIRNTSRYILGNLNGFDPAADLVAENELMELDRWALAATNQLVANARAGYDSYDFHTVYRSVYNFCVVDMSNFYLDIIKDRLYCSAVGSYERRSAQTAIYKILDTLVRVISPILAFTSEEIWGVMPHDASADPESVLFNDIPEVNPAWTLSEDKAAYWATVMKLKADVNQALEKARAAKTCKKSTDAKVTLYLNEQAMAVYETVKDADLAQMFIVSKVVPVQAAAPADAVAGENVEGLAVTVEMDEDPKCVRCWLHHPDIGKDAEHPELCPRCAAVVKTMKLDD